ncbi:IMP dehydrogenase [Klebsiella sp. G-Nf4]|uniref:transglutaminase family protein n=1 Tax=unclassified Klebsiella TaxID=2608929 RepID=UPI000C28D3E4|nr:MULTISPECIES: transglutaminase family protein [unclassified Klebsiella]PJR57264.1 IMP dehydrogenase [Klebsiella sp. I-Nf8]PJX71736.1 IMP dehydrogenase [Klebsiella sp. G-Nf4]PJX74600.1 IMP dehydrogenase [Klebsiella sp. G2-16S-Nf13]PKJ77004.1 IMP dehydrogenase [Klebsiella sp. J-Nf11]
MTIRVAIQHKTTYDFDRLINVAPHILRLRPAPHSRTHIHGYSLKVTPEDHFINWQQDPFGNYQARLVFPEKVKRLEFAVEVIADMTVINPFDFFIEEYAENFPFAYDALMQEELAPYLKVTEQCPELEAWLASVDCEEMVPIVTFLVQLNSRLANEIDYGIRLEPGVQSCQETLTLKKGSCRDTSWLLVQILRNLGLAARFASGYLVQLTADVKALDGPSGPEQDFTDLHAWCEVYLPGAGWVGLDPTSGLFAGEGHIPLACTADPQSAAPITGATDPCECEFSYSNIVTRIHEDPRVTRPYSEDEWVNINALGRAVDAELQSNDVRLTMGGEPTFISIDDMDSAQWNTDALGKDKLRLAKDLLLRLKTQFSRGGLLHYGQGKWYPGEEVPRWALGCFWRTDGEALWHDQALLARVDRDYGHTLSDAERFGEALCRQLGVAARYLQPAYEDSLYYLWLERSLPEGVDPRTANLNHDLERRRLASLLSRGMENPTGYILPVEFDGACWQSSPWPMRAGLITLIPGDSAMGYRLPLNSLPPLADDEIVVERDPFEPREPLPVFAMGGETAPVRARQTLQQQKMVANGTKSVVRTALCFEPREGKLHLFLPPVTHLENYVALVHAIEEAASELQLPVVIEGYEPPKDPRLQKLLLTPDPGVIEVNIHPASHWDELVHNIETLYEQAHQARLGAEKFMLDGRHTGTGGGNHVTLGGSTPADSPVLRRPDLLRSLVTYWQHHPGLSYLFSGMFIGPTSQAPRPDEGRDEALYEMEIAFQNMPEGLVDTPWLVDRLMRNLLVDVTGNTHRSEFCIDKLYAAGSSSGRLGLLEFRGFEMPPHARMSLVQLLLLRCLVARFWKEPYHQPLVRWGTQLHDKFMLPHFVWQDVKEVVDDLQRHGYPFKLAWLLPFEEFRFPHYGRQQIDDIELELRWAIEPWHVLGEEVTLSGTSRYVDSSVERIQVRLSGLTEGRYVLACNGRRVPLRATGRQGEMVGAVRYRAWAPPSALHPTIGVNTPLVFDLIDTWNGLSIGGCTYRVSHPGGRNYETRPVNSNEAEARRVNRFWDHGFTQGTLIPPPAFSALRTFYEHEQVPRPMAPPAEEPGDEYPHTLDLRRKYTRI